MATATHKRQDVRYAVAGLLEFHTRAGERVFRSREIPWRKVELPALAVYTLEETSDAGLGGGDPRVLERDLQLGVLLVVSLTEAVDDELDAFALEVEQLMHADPTFGLTGVVADSVLTSTVIEIAEEAGRPIGAMRLTYAVRYLTDAKE